MSKEATARAYIRHSLCCEHLELGLVRDFVICFADAMHYTAAVWQAITSHNINVRDDKFQASYKYLWLEESMRNQDYLLERVKRTYRKFETGL